ncbi:DNA-binding protein [Nonomuraea mesophila]|uniref:DNA-binding protein n=1 Tax=Nonomuraea mesophila TaxID=2530382 RepID=A0A4R5EY08_9ACTN|nr:helix-turn-helix domain-containing protein [Nonomuraea mesophila]TDE39945.1 DNA-binding protein [Nonomuraea mesophila]
MPRPEYLSIAETCERLDRTRWTVARLIKSGQLVARKRGTAPNARVLIDPDSVTAYKRRQSALRAVR